MRSYYIRSATSVTAVAAAMILPAAAQAQVHSFDVPAQSASSGIREFARQAGIQVTLAGRDGEGRATNSVRGSFPVRAGLDQLLADTGQIGRASCRERVCGSGYISVVAVQLQKK